jgi:DnaJ-class molecular chaperone
MKRLDGLLKKNISSTARAKCTTCDGAGWYTSMDHCSGHYKQKTFCEVCEGSGWVQVYPVKNLKKKE